MSLKGKQVYYLPRVNNSESTDMTDDWKKGYIWGAFQGDGWYYKYKNLKTAQKLEFACADMDLIDQLKSCIKDVYGLEATQFDHKLTYIKKSPLRGNSERASMPGLRITRSNIVQQILDDSSIRSEEWARGFIAGMYDTDGSDSRCYIGIAQSKEANRAKYDLICECLDILGKKYSKTDMAIRIRGSYRHNKLWMKNVCHSALARKTAIGDTDVSLKSFDRVKVEDVTYLGEDTVYNIETENHTYLASDVIVHNCDTWKLLEENNFNKMTINEIIEKCHENGHKHIVLTGGEPLIKPNASRLIAELVLEGFEVEVETNGSVDVRKIDKELEEMELPYGLQNNYMFTIDWKTGASGMTDRMNQEMFDHLDDLSSQDTIKFVVAEDDIIPTMELIKKFQEQGTLCKYYISPVFGQVEMPHIIEAMKQYKMNEDVRFQLQIHKYVWSPDTLSV